MSPVAATLPHKLTHELGREAATPPAPPAPGKAASVAREKAKPARAATVEERLAVVEATAVTEAQMQHSENKLIRWMLGMGVTIFVAALGIVLALHNSTNSRIDQVNLRIDSIQSDMNARFDSMQSEMNTRFDSVNARFEQVNTRIDSAVAELRAENRETNQRLDRMNERLDRVIEMLAAQSASRSSQ